MADEILKSIEFSTDYLLNNIDFLSSGVLTSLTLLHATISSVN